MLGANSSGHGAPESRTINVEANLLAQRLAERDRLLEAVRRRLLLMGLTLVVGFAALPPLFRMQSSAALRAQKSYKRAQELGTAVSTLQKQVESLQPRFAMDDMRKKVAENCDLFLGNIAFVMNSVPTTIALSTFRAEAIGGELKISGLADAENYSAARSFISAAGESKGATDIVLASTRRSDALGPNAVAFDFVKRVKVSE